MKAVVQRVSRAKLAADGEPRGDIGSGLVVLAGFCDRDTDTEIEWMAQKILGLRIFPDSAGQLNLSLGDVGGGVMVVPNFTLYGDCRKGRRPSFCEAARPELASGLYARLVECLAESGAPVVAGVFGAHMHVDLTNDGPITLILEREPGA